MNIMLVSVVERRREIGIRLAVGATQGHRTFVFNGSHYVVTGGGTLGVIVGTLIAYIIAKIWDWQFTLFLLPPVAGLAFQ